MDREESFNTWITGKKFLVVEDVDTSRIVVSGLLRGVGATTVHTAVEGEDALTKIEKKGVPDIIFCDWNMPGMDGLHLLSVVKELYPASKFIMLTANTDAEHVRAAGYLRVDGYIAKPFTRKVLLATLEKLRAAEAVTTE